MNEVHVSHKDRNTRLTLTLFSSGSSPVFALIHANDGCLSIAFDKGDRTVTC